MAPIPPNDKKSLGSVMVIGGCGFLGHHIVNMLCDSYIAQVSVVDLRTVRNRRPESDGVKYFDGDITDSAQLLSIFQKVKPDVVIHTASPVGNAKIPNKVLYSVNVDGTKCVIDCCTKTNVKALVYTSSASVISDNVTDLINADERWPVLRAPSQTDYYSETKVFVDAYF
jgi:sterol-4alpha-carboxylate 3-dehydrogenase (decarboxylating)